MGKHYNLDRGQTFIEPVIDAIEELLGAAAPSLNITVLNSTTLQVVADNDNSQQAVSVNSRWRYRQTNTTAAHPGGAAGTHSVYVTGSDNAIVPGSVSSASTDTTVYDFGLTILTSGTPGTALYRKVGEVEWDGTAITTFRHMVGPRHDDQVISPTAPVATITPVKIRGAASQTAHLIRLENSSASLLVAVASDGKLVFGSTSDTNLYRSAADTLKTDDALDVVGTLTAENGITLNDGKDVTINSTTGSKIGQASSKLSLYGKTPIVQAAALTNSSGLSAVRTLPANFTGNDLAKWLIALRGDTTALGIET